MSDLFKRVVTCNTTWVFYRNPHTRLSGAGWKKFGSKPLELAWDTFKPKKDNGIGFLGLRRDHYIKARNNILQLCVGEMSRALCK